MKKLLVFPNSSYSVLLYSSIKGRIDSLMYLDNVNGKKNKDDSLLNKLFK